MRFKMMRQCSNLRILTDVTLGILSHLYLGTIHKLGKQGLPARPYFPIAFFDVRKETQRFVGAGHVCENRLVTEILLNILRGFC